MYKVNKLIFENTAPIQIKSQYYYFTTTNRKWADRLFQYFVQLMYKVNKLIFLYNININKSCPYSFMFIWSRRNCSTYDKFIFCTLGVSVSIPTYHLFWL